MPRSPYLNADNTWKPTPENLLGFCVSVSDKPAAQPGHIRLKVLGKHFPSRDSFGVTWCLRCGKNIEIEEQQIEQREKSRNIGVL